MASQQSVDDMLRGCWSNGVTRKTLLSGPVLNPCGPCGPWGSVSIAWYY